MNTALPAPARENPRTRPQAHFDIESIHSRIVTAFLFYSGLNAVFRDLFRRNQGLILMYHRVIDPDELGEPDSVFLHPGMYVTQSVFELQMRYLARYYRVLTPDAFVEGLRQGDLPHGSCLITFDDGFRDNYTYALPILKKYNLPAVVFLSTDYVNTQRWLWPERTGYAIAMYLRGQLRISEPNPLRRPEFSRVLADRRLTMTQKIVWLLDILGQFDSPEREEILSDLESALTEAHIGGTKKRLILNWSEVAEMRKHGIVFGSHTRKHAILSSVRVEEGRAEIVASKHEIETRLGESCPAFCYPAGVYNRDVKAIVQDHYDYAFSTRRGFVGTQDDLFELKRIGIHNRASCTTALFACKISGLLDLFVNLARPYTRRWEDRDHHPTQAVGDEKGSSA